MSMWRMRRGAVLTRSMYPASRVAARLKRAARSRSMRGRTHRSPRPPMTLTATRPLAARADAAVSRSPSVPPSLVAVTLSSTSVSVGLLWDISWHRSIGRDAFLTPAHVAIYLGAVIAGITCGTLALRTTFAGSERERGESVRFWGFRAPLGAWVAIWGSFAMLTSAP